MSENKYVEIAGTRRPLNWVRIWKILTAISTLVALAVTAAFIWFAITHKTCTKSIIKQQVPESDSQNPAILPCPQLPTLFPLPKPIPEKITDVFEKLESTLSSLVEENSSLPAISMNIFYRDEIIWSGHYGSKVYERPALKPNNTTVYRIGSVTKIFAVLMLYKLYEDGKISSIDDPLSKYAPNFAIVNPYTNENITLREIASQMSGLPREAPCVYHCNETDSAEQLALLQNRTLVLPPWYSPSYSNLGYALLGRLLTENVLNQTFESWTQENIIKPLGMLNTGFEITTEVEKNMAFPYLPEGKKMSFMNIGWLAPAGQMYSTINDLAKLGMMFVQPDKQKLFKPATLREMMTPKDITPDGVTVWGSPFEMAFQQHFLVRGKGGNIDTYSATFSVIPELALGANILISSVYYLQANVSKGAVLLYNLLAPRLNETLFEIQQRSRFPIAPSPYIGKFEITQTDPIYERKATFNATIKSVENILRADFPSLTKMWIEIRYIEKDLVFQARKRTPDMPCLLERIGMLAAMYFDPAGEDNLSPGFRVPEWLIVAKRIKDSNESFVDESEDEAKGFFFQDFKNAI